MWMRFIGFGKLQHIGENFDSQLKSRILLALSWIAVLAAVIVPLVNYVVLVQELLENNGFGEYSNATMPLAFLASIGIQTLNLSGTTAAIHIFFFVASFTRWPQLRSALKRIQEKMNLDEKFYRTCFKYSKILCFILLVVILFHLIALSYFMKFLN